MKRTRRRFTTEFKQEAVRLVRDRGVSIAPAARELDIHENLLRTWLRAVEEDAEHPFPGVGQQQPEQAEITRLRREVARCQRQLKLHTFANRNCTLFRGQGVAG